MSEEIYRKWVKAIETTAKPHPCALYESSIMQSVQTDIVNNLTINHTLENYEEYISDAQFESISMCVNSLENINSITTKSRGFFLGDGTGVGKTRILAGAMTELYLRNSNRFRVLWITPNKTLIENAKRECTIVSNLGNSIPNFLDDFEENDGIYMTTYNTLSNNVEELKDWLNQTPNSLVIFDEAHLLKNANTKMSEASLIIQRSSPDLRVIYSTATAASKVKELHYMEKLGLWENDHKTFCKKLEKYGTQAVIFIALQLKYNGKICARNLGFDGIKIDVSKYILSKEDRKFHDTIVKRIKQKSSSLQGVDYLNFFNYFLTSFKLKHTIKLIEDSILEGESVIVSLNFTGDSATKKGFSSNVVELLNRYDIRTDGFEFKSNPIDYLIEYFGSDQVAEVSGRTHRCKFDNGVMTKIKNSPVKTEIKRFTEDVKPIAIITRAGSAGISLNGKRNRHHIILELPKSADVLTQQFGRAYRANSSIPRYTIVTTDIPSELRFINGIQKKLESLGAISKGDSKTGMLNNTKIGCDSISNYAYSQFNLDFQLQFAMNWMNANNDNLEEYCLNNMVQGFDEFDSYLRYHAAYFFTNLLASVNQFVFRTELYSDFDHIRDNTNWVLTRYTRWNARNWRYSWNSFTRRFEQPYEKVILVYRAIFQGIKKYIPKFEDKFSDAKNWNPVNHRDHTKTTKCIVTTLVLCSQKYECRETLGRIPMDLFGEIVDFILPQNKIRDIPQETLFSNFSPALLYNVKLNDFLNKTFIMNIECQRAISDTLTDNVVSTRDVERKRNQIKTIQSYILKGKTDYYANIVKTHENVNEIVLHCKIESKFSISDYTDFFHELVSSNRFISFVNHTDNKNKICILAKSEKYYYELYELCNKKPIRTFMRMQWENKREFYEVVDNYDWIFNTTERYEHKMKICDISYHLHFTINDAIKLWNSSTGIVLKISNVTDCRDFIGLLMRVTREFHSALEF